MTVGSIFFAVFSLIALLGAVSTVAAKSAIRSAVGLLATIVGIAGLFLKLNAQFLAAVQLIVYAGAVVVLFVFVIMLLGPGSEAQRTPFSRLGASRIIGGGLLLLFSAGATLLLMGGEVSPSPFAIAPEGHGSVEAVGRLIFTKGLVPFELATALLIVAVVGAIVVARSRQLSKAPKRIENPTLRLFHGPVQPREPQPLPEKGIS